MNREEEIRLYLASVFPLGGPQPPSEHLERLAKDIFFEPVPRRPEACRNGPLPPTRLSQFLGKFPDIWKNAIADSATEKAS